MIDSLPPIPEPRILRGDWLQLCGTIDRPVIILSADDHPIGRTEVTPETFERFVRFRGKPSTWVSDECLLSDAESYCIGEYGPRLAWSDGQKLLWDTRLWADVRRLWLGVEVEANFPGF